MLFKQTQDPVVAHLEVSLNQLANERGVRGSQTVDPLGDTQSLEHESRKKWNTLTIGGAARTRTALARSLGTSR